MSTHANGTYANKSRIAANDAAKLKGKSAPVHYIEDNRPQAIQLKKMQYPANKKKMAGENAAPVQLMMKRSTRTHNISELNNDGAEETKNYSSGDFTRTVSVGKLKIILKRESDENKRYDVLETLLDEIGGQSKGHEGVTKNSDLLEIFKAVCADLKITVEWTGLSLD